MSCLCDDPHHSSDLDEVSTVTRVGTAAIAMRGVTGYIRCNTVEPTHTLSRCGTDDYDSRRGLRAEPTHTLSRCGTDYDSRRGLRAEPTHTLSRCGTDYDSRRGLRAGPTHTPRCGTDCDVTMVSDEKPFDSCFCQGSPDAAATRVSTTTR
jgi:hypothetical protein